MIKRIALFVGSLTAAGVLALGLAAAGFGPLATTAGSGATADQALAADQVPAEPVVQVQTETVYVKPAPAPKIIHVTKKLPAPKPKVVTTTKHATRAARGGENDGNEGQDD